jgi:hypothetical protein
MTKPRRNIKPVAQKHVALTNEQLAAVRGGAVSGSNYALSNFLFEVNGQQAGT